MVGRGAEWWLELPDGSRRRVGAAGILIGRSLDCDLVLEDEHASRRHAIIHPTGEGIAVVSLGRHPAHVGGVPAAGDTPLGDGAQITFPGLTVTVKATTRAEETEPSWVLQHRGGGTFGVDARGLSVGDGKDDDLRIDGCPQGAATFHVVQRQLLVEAGAPLCVVERARRGETKSTDLAVGAMHRLRRGSIVRLGAAEIEVIVGSPHHAATTVGDSPSSARADGAPSSVRLQFLPRGGRLFVSFGGEATVAYLAGRRCDLAACLLQPPGPYDPGDPIPDDVLIPRVWPGGTATRSNVGVLLHRLRRDLVQAGLDGVALVVRAEGGGATRFAVPAGTPVAVE